MKDFCRFRQFSFVVAVHSEFFFAKVKRFSEFHFTAKFRSFKLKKPFRMVGEDKKVTAILLKQNLCRFLITLVYSIDKEPFAENLKLFLFRFQNLVLYANLPRITSCNF